MSNRPASLAAWTLRALSVALALTGPVLYPAEAGGAVSLATLGFGVVNALVAIVFSVIGALIVTRQPRNTIGWLLAVVGPAFALGNTVLDPWSQSLPYTPTLTGGTLLLLWISSWNWWLLVGPLLLIPLVFPTGRLLSPRWRWVAALLMASFAAFLLWVTFSTTFTLPDASLPTRNPVGFLPEAAAQILYGFFELSLPAAAVGSVAAIFVRYRRAAPVERQQIKWFLYAGALFVAAFILQFFVTSDSPNNTPDLPGVLFIVAILAVPVSIGIAILRYRLWDIDVVIRRTLVYGLLTALLALAYLGTVLGLQSLLAILIGQRQSTLVTVLSTLVIAALFVPLRRRVQTVIDRRFFRRKYDAARTLAGFGAALRDEVELERLQVKLVDVVDLTLQPQTIGVWLRAPERRQP